MSSANGNHKWRFYRAGGVIQARLDSGADLAALETLDQKLWVALSCPVKGLEFDEKTLAFVDTDKDGRVRASEIIAAVKWTVALLKDPGILVKESDPLPLAAIRDGTPEGKQVLASARRILANLGRPDASAIGVADTADVAKTFAQTRFNGDGVITVESAADPGAKQAIADIMSTQGSSPDRGGEAGISQAHADAFFADAAGFAAWHREAEENAASILPLGTATTAAHAAYLAVKAKVDDYFARCRLAAFDARALEALNRQETEYLALAARDLTITVDEVRGFPLARVEVGKPLPLVDSLNPAWAAAVGAFREAVVAPVFGKEKTALADPEWQALGAKFAGYEKWQTTKRGASVETLGIRRVREILAGKTKDDLAELIAQDKAIEPEVNAVASVENLVHFNRDLYRLLLNSVSFEDFYSRRRKAIFQAGTLYLDGRSLDLCVRIDDLAKHASLAHLAKTYIAYCDCSRPSTGEKMTVAAAFTGGDSDHLMVGRNGIFYDRKGRDWDATIVKVIENPISIRQAFWAPYKRVLRFIEEQVAKRAAAADTSVTDKMTGGVADLGKAPPAGKPPEQKSKFDVGVVAALGVAVGGITAALGAVLNSFFGLGLWMPLGILGVIFLVSGPSLLIAWMKLRQRNLGPILDANGWAVNGRVKVNVPFGGVLTQLGVLPPGSKRSFTDPYAEKKPRWPWVVLILLALAAGAYWTNEKGYVHKYTGYGKKVEEPAAPPTAAPAVAPEGAKK